MCTVFHNKYKQLYDMHSNFHASYIRRSTFILRLMVAKPAMVEHFMVVVLAALFAVSSVQPGSKGGGGRVLNVRGDDIV
jgi:hypothetical protein